MYGTSASTDAVLGESTVAAGVHGVSRSSDGVGGWSTSGTGVHAYSNTGNGVSAASGGLGVGVSATSTRGYGGPGTWRKVTTTAA